jgi:uridine kinase
LVEQTIRNRQVKGSNPFGGSHMSAILRFLFYSSPKFSPIQYNSNMHTRATPLVIGIAGGSGSGKTTLAEIILDRVGRERIAYLPHDAYYKDLSHLNAAKRMSVNFDHPDSLETELLVEHILALKKGQTIEMPVYDFKTHTRSSETISTVPHQVIMVEGILIFADRMLREVMDVKVFVDTDPDIRFIRRLERDIQERGRTMETVVNQYLTTVRPMHLEFVEQSKRYADVIVPEGGLNAVAMEMVVARLQSLLKDEDQ